MPYILKETDMSLLNVPAGKDLPEDIYVVIEKIGRASCRERV